MAPWWQVWMDRILGSAGDPTHVSDTVWIRDDSPFWTEVTVWTTAIGLIALSLLVGLTIRERGAEGTDPRLGRGVEAQHLARASLDAACDGAIGTNVALRIDVAPNGLVLNANTEGQRDAARRCLEDHVRGWQFAPQAQATTLHVVLTVDP